MGTRIEILKGTKWMVLQLYNNEDIKYNAVINKIGRVESREISHTNTFSIPSTHNNISTLGLNVFNSAEMAMALNTKYDARYYINDILIQEGYIVINNTNNGTINLNFIDGALDLVNRWSTISYKEVLESTSLEIPADYAVRIAEMKNYFMNKNAILPKLTEFGTRGSYSLALFPNNLNTIGDLFQNNSDDIRIDNAFNPYQSRPIFSLKTVFDLASEAFGYTPIFDNAIDWYKVGKNYMVNSGLDRDEKGQGGVVDIVHTIVPISKSYFSERIGVGGISIYNVKTAYLYPPEVSIRHKDVQGRASLPTANDYVVFIPKVSEGNVGTMNFTANVFDGPNSSLGTNITLYWHHVTPGFAPVETTYTLTPGQPLPTGITVGSDFLFDITVDKSLFDTKPTGGGNTLGIYVEQVRTPFGLPSYDITNMQVKETYLASGVLSFDKYGQYNPDNVDLTFAAPTESIKTLLAAAMHKEGILMNINSRMKTIKFFSYGTYQTQVEKGVYKDWSDYFLRNETIDYNTNYGNEYAVKNRISLSEPFPGNWYDMFLYNQGNDSKYKDFTTNFVEKFRDVESVKSINNTITPYVEFTNKGLGLVEHTGTLSTLTQQRATGTIQGDFAGLSKIENVNGSDLPNGVANWYKLIDNAVRIEGRFMIPLEEIRDLDLSVPIYVNDLGGYFIIEEISEYVNKNTVVVVKLIKLIRNLLDPSIELEIFNKTGTNVNFFYSYNYFLSPPTTSQIKYQRFSVLTGLPDPPGFINVPLTPDNGVLTHNFSLSGIYEYQLITNIVSTPIFRTLLL